MSVCLSKECERILAATALLISVTRGVLAVLCVIFGDLVEMDSA